MKKRKKKKQRKAKRKTVKERQIKLNAISPKATNNKEAKAKRLGQIIIDINLYKIFNKIKKTNAAKDYLNSKCTKQKK